MTHDEMMSLLANTLADAAGHAGCLPILDCFSPHPGEEVTVSIPMCDDTVDIVLEDSIRTIKDMDRRGFDRSCYYADLQAHTCLLDGFVNQVRKFEKAKAQPDQDTPER